MKSPSKVSTPVRQVFFFPSMIEQWLNLAFSNAYATPVFLFVCLCVCLVEFSYQFSSIQNSFMNKPRLGMLGL